ncbi:MAG: tetratricopeptide repeat protein [Candidatus Aureabacteria bacterium]|nr:tetratricopeptide repeat protein [Candidatus Auribacterota bacterium]
MNKIKLILFIFIIFLPFKSFSDNELEKAEQLFKDMKFSLAMNEYSKIIEKDPDNAYAYRRKAHCFEQLGRYKKALEEYNKSIAHDNAHFESYYDKALLQYNVMHNKAESFETLSDAIKVGYKNKNDKQPLAEIYFLRSFMYKSRKETEKAEKDITNALYLVSNPIYFMARGELRMEIKKFMLARIDFKKALSLLKKEDEESIELRVTLDEYIQICEDQIEELEKQKKLKIESQKKALEMKEKEKSINKQENKTSSP